MNLRQYLLQQLQFIENSCAAFDRGQPEEAIRIATAARVLFHNTGRSTSLLAHLGAQNIRLLSTIAPMPQFQLDATGFMEAMLGIPGFQPLLGRGGDKVNVPVSQWWEQVVSIVANGVNIRRCNIVLDGANKDGGAHVDSELPPPYKQLKEGAWTKTWEENGRTHQEKLPTTISQYFARSGMRF